jgi:uncharacterized membrane protein
MEPQRDLLIVIGVIVGACTGLVLGSIYVATRHILKMLAAVLFKLDRIAGAFRPSIADPTAAFRTLDDK